jgi:hypothetical protein
MSESLPPVWYARPPQARPSEPAWMSVSTLLNIEACPRRWSLSLSDYPDIWERSGYPPKPYLATLTGQVIHSALELITKSLDQAGCSSTQDPLFVTVLRNLGGFTRIVETKIDQLANSLGVNPRAQNAMGHIAARLRARVPELRMRLQMLIGKLQIHKGERMIQRSKVGLARRMPLSFGMHAEVELRSDALRWHGFVDLINLSDDACEIIDFKTGEANQDHKFQARVYNLLWSRDSDLNPTGRPLDRLLLSYFDSEVEISALDEFALADLEHDLLNRTKQALNLIRQEPPPALPSFQNCRFCPVRQICDDYWIPANQRTITSERLEQSSINEQTAFGDFEVILRERQSLTTWLGEVVVGAQMSAGISVYIQFSDTNISLLNVLDIGKRVRLIEASLINQTDDQTSSESLIMLNTMSEAYLV